MKKQVLLGMLSALVLGITVVGCGSKSNDILDAFDFSTAAPSSSALLAADLTEDEFNQIKNSADGFYGWALNSFGDLIMAWTGRSVSDFDNTADVLDEIRSEYLEDVLLYGGEYDRGIDGDVYYAYGYRYELTFYSKKYADVGYYASEGTMIVIY